MLARPMVVGPGSLARASLDYPAERFTAWAVSIPRLNNPCRHLHEAASSATSNDVGHDQPSTQCVHVSRHTDAASPHDTSPGGPHSRQVGGQPLMLTRRRSLPYQHSPIALTHGRAPTHWTIRPVPQLVSYDQPTCRRADLQTRLTLQPDEDTIN